MEFKNNVSDNDADVSENDNSTHGVYALTKVGTRVDNLIDQETYV